MRIGIYGGTFNPPHLGHMNIASEAVKLLSLEFLYLIPAGDPYTKNKTDLASDIDRLNMCDMLAEKRDRVSVSSIECDRFGPSYTIDTVEEIQKELSSADETYLILGFDAFEQLKDWKNADKLIDLVSFAVFGRDENRNLSYSQTKYRLEQYFGKEIAAVYIETDRIKISRLSPFDDAEDISSSDIRSRIKKGRKYRHLLPYDIAKYIEENGLYKE